MQIHCAYCPKLVYDDGVQMEFTKIYWTTYPYENPPSIIAYCKEHCPKITSEVNFVSGLGDEVSLDELAMFEVMHL